MGAAAGHAAEIAAQALGPEDAEQEAQQDAEAEEQAAAQELGGAVREEAVDGGGEARGPSQQAKSPQEEGRRSQGQEQGGQEEPAAGLIRENGAKETAQKRGGCQEEQKNQTDASFPGGGRAVELVRVTKYDRPTALFVQKPRSG